MTFHSRPWCNRGAYISDIADASKSVRVRNDEENDNTLRLRMLVIARIKSNLIYPRAVLRMTATDKRCRKHTHWGRDWLYEGIFFCIH